MPVLHRRRHRVPTLLIAGVTALLTLAGTTTAVASGPPHHGGGGLGLTVLSSAPHQVSGGDALVEVRVPRGVRPTDVVVRAGGRNVTDAFDLSSGRTLVGLVEGLKAGRTTLRAEVRRSRVRPARLVVTNHPASGPMFSGPQQQPFVCTTARGRFDGRMILGQPLVDNQDRFGIAVAREDAQGGYPQDSRGYPTAEADILGWSRDCAAERRIGYVYRSTTDGRFHWLDDPSAPPADTATTTLRGRQVPFVVRWERGTINRFIYSIAVLAPVGDADPQDPDTSLWNRRLVFSFQGGVAIGHTQGTTSDSAMLPQELLGQGYGVLWSSGTRTSTHYNLQLGGETALMLKERAVETYGVPDYTVAVGGSGGAIQQYVYAQNHRDLIDAAIPQYSYPDMVTQVIHVGDCELLEHYFDATDRANPKWKDPEVRQRIIGLNGTNAPQNLSAGEIAQWNQLYGAMGALGYQVMDRAPGSPAPALMECKPGWFGLTPLALNPTFTDVDDLDQLAQGTEGVEWTHFADLVNIYGTGRDGYARVPWDNVGVQYGLQALTEGVITPAEFLDLNAKVGSWKESRDMVTEGAPFAGAMTPENFDPWSRRNMNLSPDGVAPAPRREGDLRAIRAAYTSGMQFQGDIDIPVIDLRPYLEDELDMHNTQQSFAARQRMRNADGDASNQVIWFADARPSQDYDPTLRAFEVIDQWMANIARNPRRGVAGNKPSRAVDTCFTTQGDVIAAGPGVWNGVLDRKAAGECTQRFPIYSSSRRVAGAPFEGGIWKCALQPVEKAVRNGVYGPWRPDRAQVARLKQVFPGGVCDYRRPDVGRPWHRR
ncbi:DUF6351 family protein [Aeromicrobium sp.]|uniref:DUF6351 family protein n=1 Tax=Aeromicrobium sp. TaxID=1871063 RepID=UPI0028AD1A57|nr:DUF6351 family protein [Aeromicrobium sp.]